MNPIDTKPKQSPKRVKEKTKKDENHTQKGGNLGSLECN